MTQNPRCDDYLLKWKGDELDVTLRLDAPRKGRAVFRGNFGAASVRRQEIIAQNDRGETPLAKAWNDREMAETAPGVYTCTVPLDEVGVFSGKCCFFPEGSGVPEWPAGANFHVKVEPEETRGGNSIYTVFPRQFGSFREVARRLDFIMDTMGFRIIQTLPVFPVPTTYAVMGEYGCPFAATDFFSVDPAMAEFDKYATPLDQFRELIDAVHAKGGRLFVDLPANHTGWASTLQTHHPDWFHRAADGRFVSPGAWGVTWDDLVELDYAHPELRAYMAEVFLFWVRNGVDGFRCDAGYMIPAETWTYIVARVREEHPDTVFMLEGLGGKLEVTDRLLRESDLDWAYSEIFQTYDRGAFEWYLPGAIDRARQGGTLVHFAETHDNDRLAKGGETWSRLRVALAALLSHQGAWGIANGVEWFATEKIDVHGKNDLNWGASRNQVAFIAKLNEIVSRHPDFQGNGPIRLVQRGDGNFLAAVRGSTLILANLDCGRGVNAHWDTSAFPASSDSFDLLANRRAHVEDGIWLEPGEVRCVCCAGERTTLESVVPGRQASESRIQSSDLNLQPSTYHVRWRYPEDCARDVCVPAGCALEVTAPHPFRVRLTDGVRTLATDRSRAVFDPAARRTDHGTVLALPPYAGDGTAADARTLEIAVYGPDGVQHRASRVLLLPPADRARVKLAYTGAEIRRNPELETVLSNGAGAASRVRLAWGEVRSQYDALFAANTNPNVPADRLALWTRCRCWLQHEGYSRELNRDCVETFHADPAGRFAVWTFRVPCGMGQAVRFDFTLALAEGANAARLTLTRRADSGADAVAGPVRLVLRPDLEWRSFHGTTKAQGAVEAAFGRIGGTRFAATGFSFAPYTDDERLEVTVAGGTCHDAPEWTYCVGHPEEAARGQDGSGDLYSPGWIACDLEADATASVTMAYVKGGAQPARRFASVDDVGKLPAAAGLPTALKEALKLFIVKRDDVKTVLAGYPWFLDWGRDTFIFLQGAIPGGFRKEALEIAEAFARFEENGTLPNIIYGETAGNRDTVDAPLWFIRTLAVLGKAAAKFRPVAESIVEHYLKGTPNGIRVDAASGLVWSPSHFTWMDTNYPACTPRMGYPVEIQALWIAALRYLGGKRWSDLADQAAASLVKYFSGDGHEGLADCLDAPNGEPAAQARADWGVRPNQLFVLSLDALPRARAAELGRSIVRATERLVVPGGVRSLAAGDGRYRGVYAGDEDTSRKPAYHNGTVWAWPFPLFAEALAKTGLASRETARSLLASAVENLNAGCVCHVSEIADADAPHAQKGCRAQAWSASELLRVWLELSR